MVRWTPGQCSGPLFGGGHFVFRESPKANYLLSFVPISERRAYALGGAVSDCITAAPRNLVQRHEGGTGRGRPGKGG